MNLFAGNLPDAYKYGGTVYEMQTDFREWIKFELLLTDADIHPSVKKRRLAEIIFPEIPPDPALWDFILWFYCCGNTPKKENSGKKTSAKKQTAVYSFEYDDGYIFAAFLELYGIDLTEIRYLHWWKFKALFRGLHDCKFTDIMSYRAEDLNNAPAYKKDFLTKMKKLYALPRSLSEQMKIDELKRMKEKITEQELPLK